MNHILKCFFIIGIGLLLLGCQSEKNNNEQPKIAEKEQENKNEVDIFDFHHIDKAPETTEKHSLNDVIKVYFDEFTFDDPDGGIAIDIEHNEIYLQPIISVSGLRPRKGIEAIQDADEVIDILKKYDVQAWKLDYTFEDPETYEDGYSWNLWLQYADGSVQKFGGSGTDVDKLTPENFNGFGKELHEFVEAKSEK